MRWHDLDREDCSVARTVSVIGDRWTLLVLRDCFLGVRRFDLFEARLGVTRHVLADRLKKLVKTGVLTRSAYQDRPARYEYRLTEKGLDLWPTMVALMQWGDRYAAPVAGPPVLLEHRGCGGPVDRHRVCASCGLKLAPADVRALPGPGATPEHPLFRRVERERAAVAGAG